MGLGERTLRVETHAQRSVSSFECTRNTAGKTPVGQKRSSSWMLNVSDVTLM